MHPFHQLLKYLRGKAWAIIIAYMLGIHNIYKQEAKMPDDSVISIEKVVLPQDNTSKD